ncbi:complex I intermediate-associated protein 30, mitochondrial [Asbolus verrucosus]|uniref:Complex I intermediate-associated protein 30, mitochondrial n=1 Tax=Asbolus verrucosus TaxID=1661398 RepID=A0A482WA01_ASBVE|nr:complex I intermediate-associated protein 30, mitochondrial [Asbolus verrucosus]
MYPLRYILLVNRRISYVNKNLFHTSSVLHTFWERDDKGGYNTKTSVPIKERMRLGLQELKKEIELWKKEIKEDFESDPVLAFRPGETDIMWKFGTEESLQQWVVTSDSDHNEGYSKGSLTLTNTGKGLFSGELSTKVPKDGRTKRAGYCNIKTLRARKSFKRETYLDWNNYNMLVLKVRGDGRSYMVNIATRGYYDVLWNDIYHFVLWTRGGPYWQITKIPFSKFFLSSKGRIQDKQYPIPLNKITSFGISAGDKVNGPFSLEIDYVGLEFDPNHTEEFAYEMYKAPKYIVAV